MKRLTQSFLLVTLGLAASTAKAQEANIPPVPPMPAKTAANELPEQAVTQPRTGEKVLVEGNWTIQITPQKSSKVNVDPKSYEKIYASIPFRRSEYLANPSYRHDTTVEIMFGQMRPTVIHRQDQPQRIVNPKPYTFDPSGYQFLEYMNYPGRALRYLPGFGRTLMPLF